MPLGDTENDLRKAAMKFMDENFEMLSGKNGFEMAIACFTAGVRFEQSFQEGALDAPRRH